ncbi:MAG: hypothetical protein HDT26_13505 [Subdoligranulum sp.]|nr:hypothetical protein [Subdoligranulum sp.]
MVHTFDFIFHELKQDIDARKKVLQWLENPGGELIRIGAAQMEWIEGTEKVRISRWDKSDEYLSVKSPDIEWPAKALIWNIRDIYPET